MTLLDIWTLLKILLNSIMGPVHESHLANVLMNGFLIMHPRAALNHTRSVHNLGRITGHALSLGWVALLPFHVWLPISYMPAEFFELLIDLFLVLIREKITRKACLRPPLSAIFSLWVIFPFMYRPTSFTLYREYWSMIHWARSRKALIVELFHHCFKLPSLSYWRPAKHQI